MGHSREFKFSFLSVSAYLNFFRAVLLQPLDRVKTLVQQKKKMSIYQSTKYVVKEEGILNLWRGLAPTVIRIAPGLSLYFSLIQTSKVYFINPKNSFENFIVGLSCRSITAAIVHPTTLIKTKLEVG